MQYLATVIFLCAALSATTRYIAQSAGTFSGGTSCNGQTAITPATWNGITNSAGDVNYICGTITISAGASGLTAVGSGANGNPVSIIFDTGAILESPAFAGDIIGGVTGGAIVINGVNYYTINGQNTGTIENTLNGSPSQTCLGGICTQNRPSVGIWIASSTGTTVENLTISNIYMVLNGGGTNSDAGSTSDIWIGGPDTAIAVSGNTLKDARAGIWAGFDAGTISGLTITDNTVDHHAWGISWASGNTTPGVTSTGSLYGNSIGNFNDWNLGGNAAWHTDGIITYTYNTTAFNPIIYSNYFYGDLDGGTGAGTAHISVGTNYGSVSSGTGSGTIFNNVIDMTGNSHCAAALWDQGVGVQFYNNTIIGPSSCSTGTSIGLVISGNTAVLKNNILSTLSDMIGGYDSPATDITASNNNVFYNCLSLNCFGFGNGSGPNYSTLAAFVTGTGQDMNSVSGNPNLNASYQLQSGSSAIGLGANLTNLGIATLDVDKAGVSRPTTGAWDAGAYQFQTGLVPAPALGMFAKDLGPQQSHVNIQQEASDAR